MKRIITIGVILLITTNILAQAPEKMSYQAVVRDGSNNLVTSSAVGMQISILQGSDSGPAVYVETQTPTSNANGLVSLEIGNGSVVSGDFTTIDWGNEPHFIKTETDPAGGTNYTITGTIQLLSVPYALYSNTVQVSVSMFGDTLKIGSNTVIIPGLSIANNCAGPPTTVVDVLSPATGKTWMDRNLGAMQAATNSTDATSYGDLYQWGRAADGHQCRTSPTTSTLSSSDQPGHGNFITINTGNLDWRSPQNDNLWQGVNGVNNPCPSGYRLPTEAELNDERTSWVSNNSAGAFASPLKLPTAGIRDLNNGSLISVGFTGSYWSSTTVNGSFSNILFFNSDNAGIVAPTRAGGRSVRCLKN